MAKANRRVKALLAVVAICALIGALSLAACSSPTASKSSSNGQMMASTSSESTLRTTGTYNILVLGNDQWESTEPGNPDMICIMHVDLDNHKVTEVTVPRDTRVTGSDGKPNKLMWEMKGKPMEQQIKLVQDVTGMKIDYYAQIHFDGLEKIVDGLGGLPIDLPFDCLYYFYTKDYPDEQFKAGQQTLTGWQAMEMSRARTGYTAQDIDNADMVRQYVCRQMFVSLMQLAYTGGTSNAEKVIETYQSCIETNLSLADQKALAKKLGEAGSIKVVGTTGPFNGAIPEDSSTWFVTPDPDGWKNLANAVKTDGDLQEAVDSFKFHEFPEETPAVKTDTVKVG